MENSEFTSLIQQVKRANDIVDVVGKYLELRRSGTGYFARCPFHGEKTASFHINPNLQIFKCFGCGEGGDVVKFVQMYESCTYMEALKMLAERAGIKIPNKYGDTDDAEMERRKKQKDRMMELLRQSAMFYFKCLYAPSGKHALSYMLNRGFSVETLKKFGVGYSPDRFSLVRYLSEQGYSYEEMVKTGVCQQYVKKDADGNEKTITFDALESRLIVPIFNMNGKVIAFGGRGLDEKTIAYGKYKNTGETPLFVKKDNLFAIHMAKQQKQQAQLPNVVVVEGYMDVLAMYQAGFKRSVASMGTSLTEKQARLLSRLTSSVYICYDGDSAGQNATVRGMDLLDKAGLDVKVMSLPDNLDPDEYINKHGAEAFEKLLQKALPLPDYKIALLEKQCQIDSPNPTIRNHALAKYVRGAVQMLKQLDDVRVEHYIQVVSLRTGYSADFLRRKMAEKVVDADDQTDSQPQPTVLSSEDKARYFVASCMLSAQPFATMEQMPIATNKTLQSIFNYVEQCKQSGQTPSMDMLYTICPDATQQEIQLLTTVDLSPAKAESNKKYFAECAVLLQVEQLNRTKEQLKARYDADPTNTEILQQIYQVSQQINKLKAN